ncbi:MAG: hypothetical protein HQL16_07890 [Candidatus Omnitrophica bacterium]|nr:hypothetical protein [Candidatus Omnitrophota bacterium]
MLKMFKNKKAQNTAEYAILIALVVGGVIAMQTYAQRALQGRLRDASVTLRDSTKEIGNTLQYEPYYQNSKSDTNKGSDTTETGAQINASTNATVLANTYYDTTTYKNDAVVDSTAAKEANKGF